jgi:DNA helicase-2/ATP-dependent DNA helicase PcrA
MTRAKDHLHLVLPHRFFVHQQRNGGDRHMYTARTRFIPAAILDRFESCAWPEAPAGTSAAKNAADHFDMGARLRRMWR